jgi:hypothetical protein
MFEFLIWKINKYKNKLQKKNSQLEKKVDLIKKSGRTNSSNSDECTDWLVTMIQIAMIFIVGVIILQAVVSGGFSVLSGGLT